MENLSKLEQLKVLVAKAFEGTETKESIDSLAAIKDKIDDVAQEEQQILDKNAELLKSYKDLVMHTSYKDDKGPENDIAPAPITFEDALDKFMSNYKEN